MWSWGVFLGRKASNSFCFKIILKDWNRIYTTAYIGQPSADYSTLAVWSVSSVISKRVPLLGRVFQILKLWFLACFKKWSWLLFALLLKPLKECKLKLKRWTLLSKNILNSLLDCCIWILSLKIYLSPHRPCHHQHNRGLHFLHRPWR